MRSVLPRKRKSLLKKGIIIAVYITRSLVRGKLFLFTIGSYVLLCKKNIVVLSYRLIPRGEKILHKSPYRKRVTTR